jgi:hypothetical protein
VNSFKMIGSQGGNLDFVQHFKENSNTSNSSSYAG